MLIKVKHRGGSACQGPASIPRQSLQSGDGKSTVLKSIMCHLRTKHWWRGEAVPESQHVTDWGFRRSWHGFTRNTKLMVDVCRCPINVTQSAALFTIMKLFLGVNIKGRVISSRYPFSESLNSRIVQTEWKTIIYVDSYRSTKLFLYINKI